MKRRPQWIPVLVLLLLPILTACGMDRFSANGWSGLTIEADTLYVASGEGHLVALDISGDADDDRNYPAVIWGPFPPNEGKELFGYEEDRFGAVYAAPLLGTFDADGVTGSPTVFLATYEDPDTDDDVEANLFAVDAATGFRNWSTSIPGRMVSSPTLVGNTLVLGTSDGSLYALALEAAERSVPRAAWRSFEADGKIWSAATASNGILYFGTLEHTVYAVNAADGKPVWDGEIKVGGAVVGSPLVLGETVYFGTLDRKIYALDAATGKQKWQFQGDNWFWASLASDGTNIYAATLGGTVYAIDLAGNEVWVTPQKVSGPILATPVVLSNTLIVATNEKQIHQLNLSDGREEWHWAVGERVQADMVSQGERVYIMDIEGGVHALNTERRIKVWTYDSQK